MSLQGKGFYTYILPETEGGDPTKIVSEAQKAGLSHVLVKIADGTRPFGFTGSNDHTLPVVKALQEAGIQAWGWHYVYGDDPQGEAAVAVKRVRELGLDGYVVDAEAEYKNKRQAAKTYMAALRASLPDLPIALSSFRFPNYHPELPWSEFLEKCDLHMPQVYWEQAHNVDWQLRESKKQCDALPNARPYVPTGAAYGTPGWNPTVDDVRTLMDTAKDLGLEAVNFFQWAYCRKHLPALWTAIAEYDWPFTPPPDEDTTPPPPDSFTSLYISAVSGRDLAALRKLYLAASVQVRDGKTIEGAAAIRQGYRDFFAAIPAEAAFGFTRFEPDGDALAVEWNAVGSGKTVRIEEKLELQGKRILKQETTVS